MGLDKGQLYFNSGIMLINLEKWRRENITKNDRDDPPVILRFTTNQIIQSRFWMEICEHPFCDYYEKVKRFTIFKDMEL